MKWKGYLVGVFTVLCLGLWAGNGRTLQATEATVSAMTQTEYKEVFQRGIALGELMLQDQTRGINKVCTAEEEADLRKIMEEASPSSEDSDLAKATAYAGYIQEHLVLGSGHTTTAWQMLCDGESTNSTKRQNKEGDSENYVHAFRELCNLAEIPCFMLKDISMKKTIAMFYAGNTWYFLDVATTGAPVMLLAGVYTAYGPEFVPDIMTFDYAMLNPGHEYVTEIYLNYESFNACRQEGEPDYDHECSFYLYYDEVANTVKMTLDKLGGPVKNEYYYGAEQKTSEQGEPPQGLVTGINHKADLTDRYVGYSLYGILLRGRVMVDGTEYQMDMANANVLPQAQVTTSEITEAQRTENKNLRKERQEKLTRIAESMYQDKSYLFEVATPEYEEDAIREAMEEATSREYLETKTKHLEALGYELPAEGEPLSDRLKVSGILIYINEHIQYANKQGGDSSYDALTTGYAMCEGYTHLFRDMCVLADIPCLVLVGPNEGVTGSKRYFSDHGFNMVRLEERWFFVEPQGYAILEDMIYLPTQIQMGKDSFDWREYYFDSDDFFRESYGVGLRMETYLLEFDENGELGVYLRNRYDYVRNKDGYDVTDENGRVLQENGFFTFEVWEESETEHGVEELREYEGYVQYNIEMIGKVEIGGKIYHFDKEVSDGYESHNCYLKQVKAKRYDISTMEFEEVPEQQYTGEAVCPIPVIRHGDKVLTLGKDFTITYNNNVNITTEGVTTRYTVEGMGDYMGEKVGFFTIGKRDISQMDVNVQEEYVWTAEAEKDGRFFPNVTLNIPSSDYTVSFENNTGVGTAKVKIKGKNNSYGEIVKEFQILPASVDNGQFTIYKYTGEEIPDTYTVYKGNEILIEPRISIYWEDKESGYSAWLSSLSYKVSYENNDKIGTATIRVLAEGNVVGTLTKDFNIRYKEEGGEPETSPNPTITPAEPQPPILTPTPTPENPGDEEETPEPGVTEVPVQTPVPTVKPTQKPAETPGTKPEPGEVGNTPENGTNTTVGGGENTVVNVLPQKTADVSTEDKSGENPIDSEVKIPKVGKVKKCKAKRKKKNLQITWKKLAGANGYELQISNKKNFKKCKKIIRAKSKKRYILRNCKKNKKYYIRIRAFQKYRDFGGKTKKACGKWVMVTIS